jgi:hypothetical protein
MAASGDKTGVLPWLSMEDANRYARSKEDHPAISVDGKNTQCHVIVEGSYYNLCFQPHPKEGVYITATKYYDVE